jgi:hypothetical protein
MLALLLDIEMQNKRREKYNDAMPYSNRHSIKI